MPEVNVTAADSRALDVQQNLTRLQISASLHLFQAGLCLCNPEIVCGVGVNTNVGLCGLDLSGTHRFSPAVVCWALKDDVALKL